MPTNETRKAQMTQTESVQASIGKDVSLLARGSVVSQGLARVLRIVASDPRFIETLPNLIEESPTAYHKRTNADRLAVRTEDDSVRVMFFDDGTYGVAYYPKDGSSEKKTIGAFYDTLSISPYKPGDINHHFIGIHVIPKETGEVVIEPLALVRVGEEGSTLIKLQETKRLDPVLETIGTIMREGTIALPKPLKTH